MSALQEIANDRTMLDPNAQGGGSADRVEAFKAARQALDRIRAAAGAEKVEPAPTQSAAKDRAEPQLNFQALDRDGDGALNVDEMNAMKPPLPPRNQGPSLAEQALAARAVIGVEAQYHAQAGRGAVSMFLQRLSETRAA